MKLTCSLIYTPQYYKEAKSNFSYVCSDDKIHFRFKDYNKEELIAGFDRKLSYLMTYLFNYVFLPKMKPKTSQNDLITHFMNSSEVNLISNTIYPVLSVVKFKGFRPFLNYNKSQNIKPFGRLDKNCFPLMENMKENSFESFFSNLNTTLLDYLFDDRIVILIHKYKELKLNTKFINKQDKLLKRYTESTESDLVKLW